ncbi:MAG: hypothetical protein HEQ20_13040 [Aphanizomenon flos-aquae KM1D3_PB]|nr:MAG: hypothetical protein HEQ20_13040 [Aphanizomenon flos-aquae KM1D3_PB]
MVNYRHKTRQNKSNYWESGLILVHYTEAQSLIRWGLRFTACMAYATLSKIK